MNGPFTVKKSVIFSLAIIDNEPASFERILKNFNSLTTIDESTKKPLSRYVLRAIHFSLQNVTKANLISSILKYIQKSDLNSVSKLEFLTYYPLRISSH